MRENKAPVVLTVNDKVELAVKDAASYQAMQVRLEDIDAAERIRSRLELTKRRVSACADTI